MDALCGARLISYQAVGLGGAVAPRMASIMSSSWSRTLATTPGFSVPGGRWRPTAKPEPLALANGRLVVRAQVRMWGL